MDFLKCQSMSNAEKQIIQEGQKRIEIINISARQLRKVKIDGCLYNGGEKKCDYLIEIDGCKLAMYIEFKGCNIGDAAEQIACTLQKLSTRHRAYSKRCIVIAARVPALTTQTQNLKLLFKRKTGELLELKSRYFLINLDNEYGHRAA